MSATARTGGPPATEAAGPPGVLKQTERISAGPGPGRGPFGGGMIGQRSTAFGPSAKRLLGRLAPERHRVLAVLGLAVVSVGLSVLGPRILGRATDLVFAGLFGRQLPAGLTKQQAVEAARARGEGRLADLLQRMDVVPGSGVDFGAVGRVLLLVLAIYVASSLLSWLQGYLLNDAVQRTVFRMRSDVEDKLNRLPLPAGPSHSVFPPRASRTGASRSRASSGPEPSSTSFPCSAG